MAPNETPIFRKYVKKIMSKFFRVYAIVYSTFFPILESVGAANHLNTSFKHFMFFVFEYNCVDLKEFDAIRTLVDNMKHQFDNSSY